MQEKMMGEGRSWKLVSIAILLSIVRSKTILLSIVRVQFWSEIGNSSDLDMFHVGHEVKLVWLRPLTMQHHRTAE